MAIFNPPGIALGGQITINLEAQSPEFLANIKGPQGERGPQGPTGKDSTVVGPLGPVGPKGDKGEKGDTVVGPRGAKGDQGVSGSVPAGAGVFWNGPVPDGWIVDPTFVPPAWWATLWTPNPAPVVIRKV